jgi:hypothetical protein
MSRTSLTRILHKNLHLQPYKNQQGATCHTSNDSLCSVCEIFGYPKEVTLTGPLVARTYPQWISFSWEYLKSTIFKSNPELKEHIHEEMQKIS